MKRALVLCLLLSCGGEVAPEPISLCTFNGAAGTIDPVKFCELVPWYWLDEQGNKHPCTETCTTGSVCHYVNGDDPALGVGHCQQP